MWIGVNLTLTDLISFYSIESTTCDKFDERILHPIRTVVDMGDHGLSALVGLFG